MLEQAIIPLLLAIGCGLVIGIERNYRGRSAGISTYMLVSAGACLFVLVGNSVPGQEDGRVVAQVVTGIGFIGAGCIIKDGMTVKGFTTAATIWCSAALGSLCAYNQKWTAVAATLILLVVNLVFHPLALIIERRKVYDRKDDLVVCNIHFQCPISKHEEILHNLHDRCRSRQFAIGGERWQPIVDPANPDMAMRKVDLTIKSRYHFINELMLLIADVGQLVDVQGVDWTVL
jgi:uncharacterized membrane protein YhiD involved in acid resistance